MGCMFLSRGDFLDFNGWGNQEGSQAMGRSLAAFHGHSQPQPRPAGEMSSEALPTSYTNNTVMNSCQGRT